MLSGEDPNKHKEYDDMLNKAHELHEKGKSFEAIEKELRTLHPSEALTQVIIKKIKFEQHKKDLKEGRVYVLIGCISMVVGFILTCMKFYSNESVTLVMYGFTTLGILILFFGLYKIFS
jgi:hypothetical protein